MALTFKLISKKYTEIFGE